MSRSAASSVTASSAATRGRTTAFRARGASMPRDVIDTAIANCPTVVRDATALSTKRWPRWLRYCSSAEAWLRLPNAAALYRSAGARASHAGAGVPCRRAPRIDAGQGDDGMRHRQRGERADQPRGGRRDDGQEDAEHGLAGRQQRAGLVALVRDGEHRRERPGDRERNRREPHRDLERAEAAEHGVRQGSRDDEDEHGDDRSGRQRARLRLPQGVASGPPAAGDVVAHARVQAQAGDHGEDQHRAHHEHVRPRDARAEEAGEEQTQQAAGHGDADLRRGAEQRAGADGAPCGRAARRARRGLRLAAAHPAQDDVGPARDRALDELGRPHRPVRGSGTAPARAGRIRAPGCRRRPPATRPAPPRAPTGRRHGRCRSRRRSAPPRSRRPAPGWGVSRRDTRTASRSPRSGGCP